MSVIAEISISGEEFEMGRVMDLTTAGTVELESLVPTGGRTVPYFWVYDADFAAFEAAVEQRPVVEEVSRVDSFDDRVLYTFQWSVDGDQVFEAIRGVDGYVLTGTGSGGVWEFELRFPTHDHLSQFQGQCQECDVGFEVLRVYDPDNPDLGPGFGLTEPQREALVLAVTKGYYDIPRDCTTVELGEELGISDQAVTERLRRAIVTLSSNTVLSGPND